MIQEASDVNLEYPVHLGGGDSNNQRIQRIVLAALGPEPVRKSEEIFLVDRVQHRGGRSLDEPAIGLWYVLPTTGQRPVRSPVNPSVQILEVVLEACLVIPPRQAVDPGCRILL